MKAIPSATLADVALRAGVSRDSASVVLNGSRSNTRVSARTRARVLTAAAELRYHPNALARGLVRQRTDTIGVLFASPRERSILDNPYAAAVLCGIIGAATESGFNVMHYARHWRGAAESAVAFRDHRTDGVVVIGPPIGSDVVPELVSLGLPVVVVGTSDQPEAPSIDVDSALGARLAVEHLLSLGHTRIAHVTGDAHFEHVAVRRESYLSAMRGAGLTPGPEYCLTGAYSALESKTNVIRLLKLPQPPTALFAGSDLIAIWAIEQARERGVRVPEDLSVVGFDDLPVASQLTPPLTTVRQPLRQIGECAARMLIGGLDRSPATGLRIVAPELVVRGTTSPPAGGT